MDVMTPRQGGQRAQADFLARLPAGQQLRAVALEDARDGAVRVQLGSRTLTVSTQTAIQRGDTLQLQVARHQGETHFRLMERLSGQPMRLLSPPTGLRDGQQIVARLQAIQGQQWQLRTDSGQTLLVQAAGQERVGQHLLLQVNGSPPRQLKLLQRLDPQGGLFWVQGRNLQAWQSLSQGQQLRAIAMETVNPGAKGAPLKVMLGGQTITLQTQAPVERGQALTLELVQVHPRPILKLHPQPAQPLPWQWLQARAAPRHLAPAQALASLIATPASTSAAGSATPSGGLIDMLLRLIPGWSDLQRPASLRNALLNSGVLLEARLAHAPRGEIPQMLARDLRAQLLRLRSAEGSSPLGRLADSLLADIEMQQARSLQSRGHGDERLALTLLLRDQQEVHALPVIIERDTAGDQQSENTIWRVRLQLDLEGLGRLDAIISYSERAGVGVRFLSDDPATRDRFDARLDELHKRLSERQLPVMGLSVTAPSETPAADAPQSSTIDFRV